MGWITVRTKRNVIVAIVIGLIIGILILIGKGGSNSDDYCDSYTVLADERGAVCIWHGHQQSDDAQYDRYLQTQRECARCLS